MSDTQSTRVEALQARQSAAPSESVMEAQRVPVNVYETAEAVVVMAPLPGVMADDVEVEVGPGRLTITARARTSAPREYLMHEWHYGPFERSIEVPEGCGAEVRATFGNGQLAVSLTKGAALDSTRTVRPAQA